ncbi:MAG: hydrolase [Pseudomonadota bacterium]
MLLSAKDSLLLIVDTQEKLFPAIHQHDDILARVRWLAEVALQFSIPIVVTEQYPKGLGYSVAALNEVIQAAQVVEKTHFSAMKQPGFFSLLEDYQKKQVVVIGMEAHVCVLQTALDIKAQQYDVFLASDCVGSRRSSDKDAGVERMRNNGINIITSEMAAFEWLEKSATDTFRHISRNWLK